MHVASDSEAVREIISAERDVQVKERGAMNKEELAPRAAADVYAFVRG